RFNNSVGLEKKQPPAMDLSPEEQSYLDQLNTSGQVNMKGSDSVEKFREQFSVDDNVAQQKIRAWRQHTDSMSSGKATSDDGGQESPKDTGSPPPKPPKKDNSGKQEKDSD
ncbi:MAG: hypothetical protein KKD39_03495, partial [Candidatus Altiarchaeota archaeon]|nr:hypothetical protein [Candidatus Altiarchaeota archaeon]